MLAQSQSSLFALLLSAALLTAYASEARRAGGNQWKPIRAAGAEECHSEFHDPQSKWIQSELVVQARWRQADELRPDPLGAYNVTVTVRAMLKPWRRNLTNLRITVGPFNRSQTRRQKSRQKDLCAPSDVQRQGSKGHIFFLTPTSDGNYFRHRFLPIKFTKSNKAKLERVQCQQMQACSELPIAVPHHTDVQCQQMQACCKFPDIIPACTFSVAVLAC